MTPDAFARLGMTESPAAVLEPVEIVAQCRRPFPEEAWDVLGFREWRELVESATEAPLEFLWTAFAIAAGLLIGRGASLHNPLALYPNFYSIFVGTTGDSHKSTVLRLTRSAIRSVAEVEVLTGVLSAEAIYERLSKDRHPIGVSSLVFVDEFASFVTVARRKGAESLFPRLNSLYSCPEEDTLDRRKDSTTIIRPFVSMIAAVPAGQLVELMSGSDIKGGILNRYLFVSGENQGPKPRPRPIRSEDLRSVIQPVAEIAADLQRTPVDLSFTAEAAAVWDRFYFDWKLARHNLADELTARTHEHVLKLAVLLSVLQEEQELTPKTIALAIKLGGWLESSASSLLGEVGLDELSLAAERIVAEIGRRGGRARTREVQQALSKSVGHYFGQALAALETADRIRRFGVTATSGQVSKWVELCTNT